MWMGKSPTNKTTARIHCSYKTEKTKKVKTLSMGGAQRTVPQILNSKHAWLSLCYKFPKA